MNAGGKTAWESLLLWILLVAPAELAPAAENAGRADSRAPVVVELGVTHISILKCDFWITGMRLNTDTQLLAYVLKRGETDVPSGTQNSLSVSYKLQDIAVSGVKVGLTSNRKLSRSLAEMKKADIGGSVEWIFNRKTKYHLIK